MNIAVEKIYDKGSGRLNEDELLVKGNLFAVFDGATSFSGFVDEGGRTGEKIAVETAKKIFSSNNRPLDKLAAEANRKILGRMKEEGVDASKKEGVWLTTVAAVRLNKNDIEYFGIGDSTAIAVLKNGSFKFLMPYKEQDLETYMKWKKLADQKTENIADKLKDQFIKVRKNVNVDYGALDGEEEAANFFVFGKTGLDDVKSIIIFTDGLLIPKENPKDPENWELFIKLYQQSGLKGILKHVRGLEETDPNCWIYPRLKQHDDVAAISIDF